MAVTLGEAILYLKTDAKGLTAGLKQAQSQVSGVMESIRANSLAIGAGMTAVGGGILAFLGTSLKAAGEAEDALAQLEAVLKSTGGAAGLTSEELQKMASGLQEVTTYDDEMIMSAESLLLTFTKIGRDVFPEALNSVLDMSTALGQDLKSSAIQLGKALNDPIRGVTALQRVGVSFTETQREQIKAMVEAGDVMGAQKLILAELNMEFGGSAAAAASTFNGAMAQMKNALGDLFEVIGNALTDGGGIKGLVQQIQSIIERTTAWVQANPALTSSIVQIAGVIGGLMLVLGPLFIMLPGIVTAFGLMKAAVLAVGAVLAGISAPIVAIVAGIAALIAAGIALYKNWDSVGKWLSETWETIKTTFLEGIAYVGEIVGKGAAWIYKLFTDPIGTIAESWQWLTDFVGGLFSNIVGWFEMAYNYIAGLWQSIKGMAADVISAFTGGYFGGFSGALADGGTVAANKAYIVGERGPEVFVPSSSGRVHSNEDSRGMMGGMTFNIQSLVVREEADVPKIARQLYRMVEMGA
jgi:phage-related minor tail protein